ncbi:hypothetical protein BD309DRAFT_713759 [Dichomitus squalens]|nr:hypothetical protein BD309DRAFT_713759 [Dichomitus squalens]
MSSPLSLDDTFGALLIGTYLSLILYGVALHQSFQYYKEYPHDKTWIKVYVAVIVYV